MATKATSSSSSSAKSVTPDEVLEFTAPTETFLCPLSANVYNLAFLSFVMKDYETKRVIFEIGGADAVPDLDFSALGSDFDTDSLRKIRYDFSVDVLRMPTLSTTLVFSNGPTPLEEFRMVERHYFRDTLIKSYEFKFGFVIPNTTNTWESVYSMPPLPAATIEDILAHPYEVKSDSFYFAGDTLIMHNKAEYRYFDPDAPAAKEPAMASSSKGGTSTGASGAGGGAGAAGSGSSSSSVAQAPAAKDTDDDGKEADVGVAAAKPDDGGDDDADDGKGSPKK